MDCATLQSELKAAGITVNPLAMNLVVGEALRREEEERLHFLIEEHADSGLRVYSQEMFFAHVFRDEDPFADEDVVDRYVIPHPVLNALWEDDVYEWENDLITWEKPLKEQKSIATKPPVHRPVTIAAEGMVYILEKEENQGDYEREFNEVSMLGYFDYSVKQSGPSATKRHDILRKVFEDSMLPYLNNEEYTKKWDTPPKSHARLNMIVSTIKGFVFRSEKKGHTNAVSKYRQDLDWIDHSLVPTDKAEQASRGFGINSLGLTDEDFHIEL